MTWEDRLAGGVAVVAVSAAAIIAPRQLLYVSRDVRSAAAQPRAMRTLAPAMQVGVLAPARIAAAAAVIPRDGRYALVTGPSAPLREEASADYVSFWAMKVLLPRRRVDRLDDAEWVLSYGADLKSTGLRYRRVIDLGDHIRVGEVAR